mgnify:CR=1 FL=1
MNCRYYILRKGTNTPIYDERFHTYGNNKVSHMTNLIVNSEIKWMKWWIDYRFYMMTHTFLVDIAHRPSSTKTFAYSILGAMNKQYNECLFSNSESLSILLKSNTSLSKSDSNSWIVSEHILQFLQNNGYIELDSYHLIEEENLRLDDDISFHNHQTHNWLHSSLIVSVIMELLLWRWMSMW